MGELIHSNVIALALCPVPPNLTGLSFLSVQSLATAPPNKPFSGGKRPWPPCRCARHCSSYAAHLVEEALREEGREPGVWVVADDRVHGNPPLLLIDQEPCLWMLTPLFFFSFVDLLFMFNFSFYTKKYKLYFAMIYFITK
jgi:hypothetical protein